MQQSNPMPSNPSIHTSLHQYSYWWSSSMMMIKFRAEAP